MATSYHDALANYTHEGSFAVLAGTDAIGYNACVEICDRWVGQGRTALRWISRDGDIETVTFDELQTRAARFANVLVNAGVRRGDVVAALLPRTPDVLTVLAGVLRVGALYQPLFTAFGPKAIETRIRSSGARLILTDRTNRPKLEGLDLAPILVTDQPGGPESMSAAMAAQPDVFEPAALSRQDPFLMMFTSGTTGTPKGIKVPYHMLRSIWGYMRYGINVEPEDIYWNLGDPGWAYGLYYGLIGAMMLGEAAIMNEAPFSVEGTYDVIRRFGVTNLAGSPTAYRAMAASPLPVPAGVNKISSAGEPLDPETGAWLRTHFACPARDHYGQSELGMIVCDYNGLEHPRHPGSPGYALPGYSVVTLRDDGSECDVGEQGVLAVDRSSSLYWFEGYHGRTEQPYLGDYYLTGDNAVRESDGSFRVIGRLDDVITSSGYRIGPTEVESALMEHPAVAETAVIGRPDVLRTEVVKAFVILAPGFEPSPELAEEITMFVKTRLAAYSYPREIEFVTELPKTPSGKVQRFVLRQMETERCAKAQV